MQIDFNNTTLKCFDNLVSQLIATNPKFSSIGEDIFLFKNNDHKKIDLYINCCTHGNEIIGLLIINNILTKLSLSLFSTSLNIAFGIANRKAVLQNKRAINKDLNRSFSRNTSPVAAEDFRADDLEALALQSNAVLDIHQTSSASLSPFFVLKELAYNINFFNCLQIESWPIILYKEGSFSKDGEAYSSCSYHHKIPFITIELGLAGSNMQLEVYFSQKLIELVSRHTPQTWKNIFEQEQAQFSKTVDIYREYKNIMKETEDDYLTEGLQNLSLIEKDTVFAFQNHIQLKTECDLYALFPKYGVYKNISSELIRLLKKQ